MADDTDAREPAAGGGRTILVVAPDSGDRAALRRLLESPGARFTVIEAATGQEGLAFCRADEPDSVLLHYDLPDMDGATFLLALQDEAGPSLPVVLLTDTEDAGAAAAVADRGAQGYLILSTLTAQALARSVENAIEVFNVRRALEEKTAALELRTWQLEAVRDELQQRLVEVLDATRAKDQFLAVMSHELRTPLNAILGYADLMEMGVGGELPESHRRHVERIRVGGRHLLDLINDVLDLSQPHGQKLELDIRPVAVEPVLEEVAALLDSQARVKGLRLEIQPIEGALPPVAGDLRRLRQILTNLVGNAIKFTDQGGVTIHCVAPDDGTVHIEVHDSGIGVAPEALPLVFTEFYQAHGSLTREKGGSGLGLAIARRLARDMGGEILAESTLGRGSVFTLILPAGDPESAVARRLRPRLGVARTQAVHGRAAHARRVARRRERRRAGRPRGARGRRRPRLASRRNEVPRGGRRGRAPGAGRRKRPRVDAPARARRRRARPHDARAGWLRRAGHDARGPAARGDPRHRAVGEIAVGEGARVPGPYRRPRPAEGRAPPGRHRVPRAARRRRRLHDAGRLRRGSGLNGGAPGGISRSACACGVRTRPHRSRS
jgi:signal transduction histidine kinase